MDTENALKDDAQQVLKIRGPFSKVIIAKQHVLDLIEKYTSNTVVIDVPSDCMPIILGKGGAGIKALREKYVEANIDVEHNAVHVQSKSDVVRQEVKAFIDYSSIQIVKKVEIEFFNS
jgi:rRNA processing protein Krr1/Pno1